ncbi:MAG: 50S ribosomal protein L13 [Proteobacteria bacterium]|nr:50S ribosomal protein L13 [Pseudomonadota bacterium]
MKTVSVKPADVKKQWTIVDATGQTLGRLSTEVARILRGKHKANFAPHIDGGDFVVVVNAEKVNMSGLKLSNKFYFHHTGWIGGIKAISAQDVIASNPERVLTSAIKGMLPKSKLGRKMSNHLKVYSGTDHPHKAQNPVPMPTR